MSRWFRHYAGMMRDDKLVSVAIRSKQSVERVVWVWGAILESAAEIDDGGRYEIDCAEVAYFLRADDADILSVVAALEDANRVSQGVVVHWSDRQFQSDRSADRQRRYRERKANSGIQGEQPDEAPEHNANGVVTSPSRHRDAPETETETETKNPPSSPRKRRTEGKTLLPDDWVPPEVSDLTPKAQACAKQWTRDSYETVAESFSLYWRREQRRMADWPATWCGWVIREHSKVMRDQRTIPRATSPPSDLEVLMASVQRKYGTAANA